MNIDLDLQTLWQGQQPPSALAPRLFARITRQRQRMQLWRLLEILLSVGVVLWFGHALWVGAFTPRHWLLLPFFAVFLVVNWWVLLRQQPAARPALAASTAVYAAVRQQQLRQSLLQLKLASLSAQGLLAYALLALIGSAAWGEADWLKPALALGLYALGWFAATRWLVASRRRRALREYRALRRLVPKT